VLRGEEGWMLGVVVVVLVVVVPWRVGRVVLGEEEDRIEVVVVIECSSHKSKEACWQRRGEVGFVSGMTSKLLEAPLAFTPKPLMRSLLIVGKSCDYTL